MRSVRQSSWPLGLGCLLALVGLAGCGSDLPTTVPVSGTVTLNGGPWPKPGTIYFVPVEPAAGFPRRPGTGEFDTSGEFTAGTFKSGDGLMPGTYLVRVECWDVPPSMDDPSIAVSHVPAKYRDGGEGKLELEVSVDDGAKMVEFDVRD